jgi:hypothetical protein
VHSVRSVVGRPLNLVSGKVCTAVGHLGSGGSVWHRERDSLHLARQEGRGRAVEGQEGRRRKVGSGKGRRERIVAGLEEAFVDRVRWWMRTGLLVSRLRTCSLIVLIVGCLLESRRPMWLAPVDLSMYFEGGALFEVAGDTVVVAESCCGEVLASCLKVYGVWHLDIADVLVGLVIAVVAAVDQQQHKMGLGHSAREDSLGVKRVVAGIESL